MGYLIECGNKALEGDKEALGRSFDIPEDMQGLTTWISKLIRAHWWPMRIVVCGPAGQSSMWLEIWPLEL